MYIISAKPQIKSQLLLVLGIALAAIAVIVTTSLPASAKHGSTSNVRIGGVSSCPDGIWTVDGTAYSNVTSLLPQDIYANADSVGHIRRLVSNVSLSMTVPYTFQYTPVSGLTDGDTLYTVTYSEGSAPLTTVPNEPVGQSTRMFSPC